MRENIIFSGILFTGGYLPGPYRIEDYRTTRILRNLQKIIELTTGATCSILYKYSVFCVGEIGWGRMQVLCIYRRIAFMLARRADSGMYQTSAAGRPPILRCRRNPTMSTKRSFLNSPPATFLSPRATSTGDRKTTTKPFALSAPPQGRNDHREGFVVAFYLCHVK